MGIKGNLVVFLLSFAFTLSESRHVTICPGAKLNKSSFPHGFVFGSATSAYQIEGAADEGGRGPSIWDNFIRQYPNKIKDGSNATVAVDSYHRYKEDVEMMRYMGLDAYRFSISWPRVLPYGKLSRGVNKEGINYYNDLIDELLKNGIVPFVTLFHWDLPQDLEDEYDGFLSNKIVDDFRNFADLCFREFGDRVKNWITLNEPWSFSYGGYESSLFAPGRCSSWQNLNCTKGNSSTEPYLAAHNQLLSHAAAVKLYRRRYQKIQKGKIGIALVTEWFVPKSHSPKNHDATQRALDFMFGWFMDPIATGDYPESMRSHVNDRLPNFTEEDSKMLKGSFDFIGINYYSAKYVYDLSNSSSTNISYTNDAQLNKTCERHGIPLGKPGGSSWLTVYPRGILDLLLYIKIKYKNPIIYITENGIDELNNATLSIEQALNDTTRENYYKDHLCFLRQAIENHVNVKGYFAWSLMDNFEWSSGYSVRFGLNYVDYDNGLKRIPKNSAKWFKKFLHHDEISDYQPRISDQ